LIDRGLELGVDLADLIDRVSEFLLLGEKLQKKVVYQEISTLLCFIGKIEDFPYKTFDDATSCIGD